MSLGVEGIGVIGVFGVPSVVALGFPDKFNSWVPGKVIFGVSGGSMFTIFCPNSIKPKP